MQSSLLLRSCVIDVPKFTRRCRSRSSNSLTPVNTVSPKIGSFAKASLFSCNKISCADQNNLFRNLRRRPPRLPKACDAEHLPGPLALSQRLLRNVDWSLSRHDVDIFRLAIPALCSTLLDPLMGLVDTALLGRLGSAELAGAGLANLIFAIFTVVFNFLLFATTPLVAGAVAREAKDEASQMTSAGLWTATAIGLTASVVFLSAAPAILALTGAAPNVLVHAVPYLRCRALACPALLCSFTAFASFRGWKNTRAPFIASLLATVMNFCLDMVFMFGMGLGPAGAALATAVSQYMTLFVLVRIMLRTGMLQAGDIVKKQTLSHLPRLLVAGASLMLRSTCGMATFVALNLLIARLGPTAMAASEVGKQGWIVSAQSFTALDVANQALTASYLGVGDRENARKVVARVLLWGTGFACLAAASLIMWRSTLPMLFVKDEAVVAQASLLLPILAAFLPFDAMGTFLESGLLGAQDHVYVSNVSLLTSASTAFLLFLAYHRGEGLLGLWAFFKVPGLMRLGASAARYFTPNGPYVTRTKKTS